MTNDNMRDAGRGGNLPLVFERDGIALASTKGVAEGFSKAHADVLKAARELIRKLKQSRPEFAARNFFPVKNKGLDGEWFMEEVNLTRDGFTLLAMGFTGTRALEFKLRYIDAFNAMEATLRALGGMSESALEVIVRRMVDERIASDPRRVSLPYRLLYRIAGARYGQEADNRRICKWL